MTAQLEAQEAVQADATAVEQRLIAAAQADPRAFGPLYERHYDAVFRYCYVRLGDRQAAEDAAAEVFLKALARLRQFRGGVFAAWLYTIARHILVDLYHDSRRTASWDEVETVGGAAAGPEAAAESRALRAALAALSEDRRTVLELQLAGWSGPEIAAALGRSQEAIRMLRYRAVEDLRRILADVSVGECRR